MRRKIVLRAALTLGAALAFLSSVATAATITSGNLVVYRVGDGAAALGTTAAKVFLDEYTTSGTLVQSISTTITAVGNATTEGIISRSQDGQALVFTGYNKAAGGTSPAGDTYLVTPRVIGTLTFAGTPDTTTTLTNDNGSTAANTIRSAASIDGTSSFWTSTSSRVGYFATAIGTSGGTAQIDARNSREVSLADNILYASNGSTAITGKVQQYGVTPTGATAATPVATLALTDAVNGFVLVDLDSGVAGADTLYALSTVEALLRKYTYNGTTWSASGSISSAASNLTAQVSGSTVNLYLTSTTKLQAFADTSGYGNTITAGTPTDLVTAGTNMGFRGIGTLVVPEPSSLVLIGFGCCIAFVRRRNARG
jgi:PEP-CTERM motif